MKPLENLERFIRLNNFEEVLETEEWMKFCKIKNTEKELEEFARGDLTTEQKKSVIKINNNLCKKSYYSYFKMTFTANNPLVLGQHIELICDVLTLADMGVFKDRDTKTRIAISVPPRHLKSTSITNSYPAWVMGRNPWKSTIVTSYGDNLVQKSGQKCREKIKTLSNKFFGSQVKAGVDKKAEWEIEGGGRFKGATIRGGATGEGAELLILDDVVKNREEANSKTIQQKIIGEYHDTYLTRLHRNGVLIVVMTRWHHYDLRGYIDETEHHLRWLRLDLSAINETHEECESDPLGRDLGEALYPQMFDELYFEPFKRNERTWWSLFKQKPQKETGQYFKRTMFQYFTEDETFIYLTRENGEKDYFLKSKCWGFQTIDTAQKANQENDETGIETWVITPENDMLLYDVYHGRIEIPEQERMINLYWNKHSFCSFQAVEDKSSGIGIIQKLKNEGRPVKAIPAKQDKVQRAAQIILYYDNMKVFHKSGAEWLNYYEEQLLSFPSGKHDDLVDTSSIAGNIMAESSRDISIV